MYMYMCIYIYMSDATYITGMHNFYVKACEHP